MGIRGKSVVIVTTLLAAALVVFVVFANTVLLQGFRNVEDLAAQKDALRARDAIKSELTSMSSKAADWSYWDDTYQYVTNRNKAYEESNLVSSLASTGISYWLFYDKQHRLVKAVGYDLETSEAKPVPAELANLLKPSSKFLDYTRPAAQQALLNLSSGPILAVSRPILKSDKSGPEAGTIVVANDFDAARLQRLNETSHLTFKVYSGAASDLPTRVKTYMADNSAAPTNVPRTYAVDDATIYGYVSWVSTLGLPALVVEIENSRNIFQEGQQTVKYGVAGIVVIMVMITVAIELLLNRFVSSPVSQLALAVSQVTSHHRGSVGAAIAKRRDEVGKLAAGINQMLGSLDAAHRDLELAKQEVDRKVEQRTHDLSVARKELEVASAQLAASVQSLPFGFALVDQRGHMLFTNDRFMRPDGNGALKEAATLEAAEAVYGEGAKLIEGVTQTASSKRAIQRQISNDSHFYQLHFSPVLSGKGTKAAVIGTVIVAQDVTDALATQRARDEFFSIASHELRTPLTAIRGNSQLIMEHFGADMHSAEHTEMVADIHEASVRLISIVNDFLDSSRLEMGKVTYKLQSVDLAALARSVEHDYAPAAARQDLALRVEAPADLPAVTADPDRVRQIIVNLMGNALRYTARGGITLKLESVKGKVQLAVIDTGAGIAPETRHLLFRKFQQAGTSILTRDGTNSTGLGLYIARLLARGMDGDLRLESSELGAGSTFVLELPVQTS